MFVVTVHFEIQPGHEADFRAAVLEQAASSLREELDCRQFDVCHDPDAPGEVFLYEIYTSADAFDAHVKTPHFAAFGARTQPWVARKTVRCWHRLKA